ncbi:hypothetical protein AZI87_06950 [Bdellovibrio bacteriovorus]|uniref:Uncharacterized protein n=1 Tax=Bdellovibrio bacteriovorus TaxID=959 RepID=A0A162GU45_BDEBC|nr:hypothetical protein [Bdellovibrio bacteriovorus]KYG68956.1 hypothetical protein AZI87_06950 [Bdellovibrio bacteriovorus]
MSGIKLVSKGLLALALLLSAGLTFHTVESEAARKQTRKSAARAVRNKGTPAGVFALYQNPVFGYGKCLPRLVESADTILNRNGIDTVKANDKEKIALAKGVAQVERLLGQPIPRDYQYDYQWIEASGPWNSGISRRGFVTVKRPRGSLKGQLTGRMMHELGHRFGHANNNENYNEYRQHMRGKKCMITTYCGKSLNEEFAEVFEAYVVNPDFLAKHCPDSYAYFKNKLFRNSEDLNVSCEDPDSILEHDEEDDINAVEDSDEEQIDESNDFKMLLPELGPIPAANPRFTNIDYTLTPPEPTVPLSEMKIPAPTARPRGLR